MVEHGWTAGFHGLAMTVWTTAADLAPWLLLGLVLAGILHRWIPRRMVQRWLVGPGRGPVIRAALLGVPLPLCSCSVLPVAAQMRAAGASRGATASFLASTPATGVDSFAATWGMLGPVVAIVRVAYAFGSGLLVGAWIGRSDRMAEPNSFAPHATSGLPDRPGFRATVHHVWTDLFGSLRNWIILGIGVGALLSWALPAEALAGSLGHPVIQYGAMLLIGLPLYTCATGSIPIAAALVAKGLSPGAALVFLAVGPATSAATMGFVGRTLGRDALIRYVAGIALSAVLAGLLLDHLLSGPFGIPAIGHDHARPLEWWQHLGAAMLLLALVWPLPGRLLRRIRMSVATNDKESVMRIHVPSITCSNCVGHVERALRDVPGVESVAIDLANRIATVNGTATQTEMLEALAAIRYPGEVVGP